MKNIFVLSLLAGIASLPLFFMLLVPIAISQLGSSGTSETFNTITFASIIALLAAGGCVFIAKYAKGTVSVPFGFNLILSQVLFGIALYGLLIICSKLIISSLPQETLYNSSGADTETKQAIQWATVLVTLLFQHLFFWRYIVSKYSN